MAKKILVAEDSSVLQSLIRKVLTQVSGYEIEVVKNGLEVIAKLESGKYDIILMDINMPKLNGVECTKQIREKGNTTPIIAITGNALNYTDEEYKAVGINEFLPKPIDFDLLVASVRKWTV